LIFGRVVAVVLTIAGRPLELLVAVLARIVVALVLPLVQLFNLLALLALV
jgi:hypothetical protein